MRIEEEMEEKRRESKRRHEERMHGMLMNIFQQMMMTGGGWATAPFPPMPVPYPAPTEDPNTPSTNGTPPCYLRGIGTRDSNCYVLCFYNVVF